VHRQSAVQTVWVRLYHYDQPATLLRIGLLRPAADVSYLLELARLRLDATRLSAPVVALLVQADLFQAGADTGNDLFGTGSGAAGKSLELLERLRMRLGMHSVFGVRAVPEHRPESAWASVTGQPPSPGPEYRQPIAARPVWMLAEPLKLKVAQGRPVYRDVLDLGGGPERIETGWWDGRDIRRDYYIARNRRGMRLWVFRDYRESAWYLHGLFG
jgi:protein ImuB